MAMTKKEQAMVADLRRQLALHHTGPVERDVPPPIYAVDGAKHSHGWDFSVCNGRVHIRKGVSTCAYHKTYSEDEMPPVKPVYGWAQNPQSYYSSKLLALKAGRYKAEQDAAKLLANIDEQIAAEQAKVIAETTGGK
jgi:hypothetical protein